MTKVRLADRNNCTGCSACENICPRKAIKMVPDEEGFIQPVIQEELCVQCGKCENICPVLHPSYKNEQIDTCYAMWANDDIRKITSTAGFFYLSAQHILQQDGKVYGAAWTEDWYVHHIGIDNEKALPLLCGSKYLQSSIENTYQEVKSDLNTGRKVLFSGCPCQIAGLYAYLGEKEYRNLITIEVICHGVPSPKAFQKYLHDNFENKTITQINFRDKTKYGWRSSSNIFFDDGSVYRESEKLDPFYRAFLPCMILRRSCSACPFSRIPRQADISIGDFWGIMEADKSWDDKKGTGLILVNNTKGKAFFDGIKTQFKRIEKFPLEAATKVNKTILHPFRANPGRKHFFSAINLMPFDRLVERSLEHKYDVGIVGLRYGINYGSIVTYYALYELVREMGYDAVMLPKPPQLWDATFDSLNTIAQRFILRHCNVFNKMEFPGEINRMNDRCENFILGSDVVWSYRIVGKDTDQFFFLDWVESGHKKIAFASSFGNTLSGPEEYIKKAVQNLNEFHAISIREDCGVFSAKKLTGRDDIVQVLDPVFLCDKKLFDELGSCINDEKQTPIVFAYLLKKESSDLKKKTVVIAAEHLQLGILTCGNPNDSIASKETYGDDVLTDLNVGQWISKIKNCSIYIGDSYHGLCFALLYHRPFIIVYTEKSDITSHQRFGSLLKLCGLDDRILYANEMTSENIIQLCDRKIDWNDVEYRLNKSRAFSVQWLKKAMDLPLRKTENMEYELDVQKRIVSEQSIQISILQKKVETILEDNKCLRNDLNHFKRLQQFNNMNDLKEPYQSCVFKEFFQKIRKMYLKKG